MTRDASEPDTGASPLAVADAARSHGILDLVAQAVAARHVALAFQPVRRADERTGPPAFHEALVRVIDPAGRVVPARDFIDRIERTETGRRVDVLALEMGLAALRSDPGLALSVNLSARSIGYRPWTAALEAGTAADPASAERLILEIEERSALAMREVIAPFAAHWQQAGVCFALDGFGAGATDLRGVRDLGFDLVKIDGRASRGVAADPEARVLARALQGVAARFGMLSVAQGVEAEEDAEVLAAMGVDCVQGFLAGPPVLGRPNPPGSRSAA
ncbi:EAL domain-containing protein (putative c-di-GMP-specific phosphodiesterase class I) [Hasllibacter halocynthiae]|uniref:EAL domain-containing protein (Putative c-di-GMP-specific phosphodiesterase class I) n=1 Tax=Hasllibacter halocynthiae TaxID=595589 RepID=A0A2T0X404_9RHOB|nr:EAL domain-containing protein [Hasllibacter halocynthiae]PRY93635.1 EAL domain-containing protein (putative c-di-GMP-specific phosphodiesterase class I) [Hasllibacter halocynthiae]